MANATNDELKTAKQAGRAKAASGGIAPSGGQRQAYETERYAQKRNAEREGYFEKNSEMEGKKK
jgi:hypothetical protein